MVLSEALCEFAESPERFVEIPSGISVERFDDPRRCIVRDRIWATITAVRVAPDELDDLVEDVRRVVSAQPEVLWHLGPSSLPDNLYEELRRRGFEPPAHRPAEVRALALATEPDAPNDVEVRRCETFAQYADAHELSWEAFGTPEERRDAMRPTLRDDFDEMERTGLPLSFLAYLDGRMAATAMAVPSARGVFLGGGSVAAWARGRGLYRALVRARWDYAVARDTPALVTHANPTTSYRTLLRLGFVEVGTIRRLEDRTRPR